MPLFECNRCKKIFSQKCDYDRHINRKFKCKIKMLPPRRGERFASALTNINLSNKVHKIYGSIRLKDYIKSILESHKKRH